MFCYCSLSRLRHMVTILTMLKVKLALFQYKKTTKYRQSQTVNAHDYNALKWHRSEWCNNETSINSFRVMQQWMIHYCGPKSWLSISAAREKISHNYRRQDNQYHIILTLKLVLFSISVLGRYHTVLYPTSPPLTIFTNHHWKLKFYIPRKGFLRFESKKSMC